MFFFFQIYTEWGNHYLEKARFKRLILNLQIDLSDGVLLADVVEAVCKYLPIPLKYDLSPLLVVLIRFFPTYFYQVVKRFRISIENQKASSIW